MIILQFNGHHSNSSSPPSPDNSTSMETLVDNLDRIQTELNLANNLNSLFSVLTVTDYGTADGYYWCTVNAIRPTHNPSQVLRISTCPFIGDSVGSKKCSVEVELSELTNRCASDNASIDVVEEQFGSIEQCDVKDSVSTPETTSTKETATHTIVTNTATTDTSTFSEVSTISTTTQSDQTFPVVDTSSSSGFPMHFIWMIIGIAFATLVVIIVLMLIGIAYLNHKRIKIRGMMYLLHKNASM